MKNEEKILRGVPRDGQTPPPKLTASKMKVKETGYEEAI